MVRSLRKVVDNYFFITNFAEKLSNCLVMLGIDNNIPPIIDDEFKEEMREAVRRKYDGEVSERDEQISIRSKSISSEYYAVWK